MHIACTTTAGRGDTDRLLASLAERLAEEGLVASGVVQINTNCGPDRPCDMDVAVLPAGPTFRISETRGPGARGCRLDPDALERSVAEVAARLTAETDVLIINKFGKHEAEGRGFRDVIARALELEVPVLVGVNGLNLDAFSTFAGGMETRLPPEPDALLDWVRSHARTARV